jgi:hypothetical protein
MHALIRQGNGKYYVSAVFGYYNDVKSKDDYQRYLESIHSPYYIVWDSKREHLIKWFAMQPNTKYLIPQLLIIDTNRENWIADEDGVGGVEYLPKILADKYADSGVLPKGLFDKCVAASSRFHYNPYPEIITEKDIENLDWVSGGFHDAYIKEEHLNEDGELYLLFKGTWGCSIEVWFWGDLEYDTSSRNPEECDSYWYGSSLNIKDGFIYFVDEADMSVEEITNGYCWFKARHMKYHVIPD